MITTSHETAPVASPELLAVEPGETFSNQELADYMGWPTDLEAEVGEPFDMSELPAPVPPQS